MQAKANAGASGAFSLPLVRWARAAVLETLNTPATRSTLLDEIQRRGAHRSAYDELFALLDRTVCGIENVSALVVGPRGAGKHRLLSSVLRTIPAAGGGSEPAFFRVDLNPLLVPDEPTALMAIASQLQVVHASLSARTSFCDGLRYLLHLLRRARPGCIGDAANEGQSHPVLFVLHDFEHWTQRPKQTLLYSLFDLMQTDDAHMAVIGLTTRIDVADLLEKRVRSRCSQRQFLLPALEATDDCARLLDAALTLPKMGQNGNPGFAMKAERFQAAWTANTRSLCASLSGSAKLCRRLSLGLTTSQIQTALRLALSQLSAREPLVTVQMIEDKLKLMVAPRDELSLSECSIIEILLLFCLKKLTDKELPPPHTFRMVMHEYARFLAADSDSTCQYDYPHATLNKSFEHVCALGLVNNIRESHQRNLPNDQVPLKLRIDPQTINSWVSAHPGLPLVVRRFATSWTL